MEEVRDALQDAYQFVGIHDGAAAAAHDCWRGVGAYNGEGAGAIHIQREDVAFVLEQNDSFLSDLQCYGVAAFRKQGDAVVGLAIDHVETQHETQDAAHLIVDSGDGNLAAFHSR